MQFSEDQILALAPDDASRRSGKDLSNPGKWVSKGANEQALWGECQGSGSKPYQTQVDLGNLAFKCSCPSRKFPCKHGLGLLLLYARQPQGFTSASSPDWVTEWLARRADKEEKKAEKKNKPVDEAAQAKRRQAREQKVNDGIEELLRWIKDIIRNGMLNLPEKGAAYWENMSKRMIDAQAPGLATMVRELGEINFYREGWQTRFLDQLLKIYLVIKGYTNIQTLPGDLQQDLLDEIGFTQNQDELKAQPGIRDQWFVLARQTSEEDQLIIERNWLYGTQHQQYALILQFYVRTQPPTFLLTPGMITDATLVYYPSALPLRALVKETHSSLPPVQPKALDSWMEVITKDTKSNSIQPFTDRSPFIINGLRPVLLDNDWWLQDLHQHLMPVKKDYAGIWKLLSLSGGKYLTMSVIGKDNEYEPVGVWYDHEYKIL